PRGVATAHANAHLQQPRLQHPRRRPLPPARRRDGARQGAALHRGRAWGRCRLLWHQRWRRRWHRS
ncbi:hypothetical protein MNEG_15461, partial [Monoraphidium neglectum]